MARNKFDVDENLESPFSFAHLKRAMKYVKKHAFKMVLALVLSCIASVVALFGPKIMQWALDDAVPHNDFGLLGRLALFYTLIVIIGIVFTTIRARMMAHVSQEIVYDIREDLFAHLQRLPFSYYDSRPAGKILVRVINYVNSVSDMLSNGIINSILEIVNVAFIIVFMYSTNALLATIVVAGLPLFAAVIWYIKPRQRKYWQAQSNKNSNYNAYLAESIDGVRVSQLFAREEENISIMKRLATACRAAWLKAVYVGNAVWLSSEIISQIVFTVMYIAGVYWIGGAMVSFGVLLAMGQYVSRFWQPITNLANIYNMFINNIAYLERIFETMDEPVVVDDLPGAQPLPAIRGEVEFRDVTFAYEPGVNILENLSFSVRGPARPRWSILSAGSITSPAVRWCWTANMTSPASPSTPCAARWASCFRTALFSAALSWTTSAMAGWTPPTRKCRPRPGRCGRTISSWKWIEATTPRLTNGAAASPKGSGS